MQTVLDLLKQKSACSCGCYCLWNGCI